MNIFSLSNITGQVSRKSVALLGGGLGLGIAAWLAFALIFSSVMPALADACSDLQAKLARTSGATTAAGTALQRQLRAVENLGRQRGCSKPDQARSFLCRDTARRIAEVRAEIAALPGGSTTRSAISVKMAALGCGPAKSRSFEGRPRGVSEGAALFCVRLADGYYFPAPNSQFKSGDEKVVLDQCQFLCRTKEMDIYRLPAVGAETSELISLRDGKLYEELPFAYSFREATSFERCDPGRYYRRVEELRARSVTPQNLENAVIPLPTARPDIAFHAASLIADQKPPTSERTIRIVGPVFLPESNEDFKRLFIMSGRAKASTGPGPTDAGGQLQPPGERLISR